MQAWKPFGLGESGPLIPDHLLPLPDRQPAQRLPSPPRRAPSKRFAPKKAGPIEVEREPRKRRQRKTAAQRRAEEAAASEKQSTPQKTAPKPRVRSQPINKKPTPSQLVAQPITSDQDELGQQKQQEQYQQHQQQQEQQMQNVQQQPMQLGLQQHAQYIQMQQPRLEQQRQESGLTRQEQHVMQQEMAHRQHIQPQLHETYRQDGGILETLEQFSARWSTSEEFGGSYSVAEERLDSQLTLSQISERQPHPGGYMDSSSTISGQIMTGRFDAYQPESGPWHVPSGPSYGLSGNDELTVSQQEIAERITARQMLMKKINPRKAKSEQHAKRDAVSQRAIVPQPPQINSPQQSTFEQPPLLQTASIPYLGRRSVRRQLPTPPMTARELAIQKVTHERFKATQKTNQAMSVKNFLFDNAKEVANLVELPPADEECNVDRVGVNEEQQSNSEGSHVATRNTSGATAEGVLGPFYSTKANEEVQSSTQQPTLQEPATDGCLSQVSDNSRYNGYSQPTSSQQQKPRKIARCKSPVLYSQFPSHSYPHSSMSRKSPHKKSASLRRNAVVKAAQKHIDDMSSSWGSINDWHALSVYKPSAQPLDQQLSRSDQEHFEKFLKQILKPEETVADKEYRYPQAQPPTSSHPRDQETEPLDPVLKVPATQFIVKMDDEKKYLPSESDEMIAYQKPFVEIDAEALDLKKEDSQPETVWEQFGVDSEQFDDQKLLILPPEAIEMSHEEVFPKELIQDDDSSYEHAVYQQATESQPTSSDLNDPIVFEINELREEDFQSIDSQELSAQSEPVFLQVQESQESQMDTTQKEERHTDVPEKQDTHQETNQQLTTEQPIPQQSVVLTHQLQLSLDETESAKSERTNLVTCSDMSPVYECAFDWTTAATIFESTSLNSPARSELTENMSVQTDLHSLNWVNNVEENAYYQERPHSAPAIMRSHSPDYMDWEIATDVPEVAEEIEIDYKIRKPKHPEFPYTWDTWQCSSSSSSSSEESDTSESEDEYEGPSRDSQEISGNEKTVSTSRPLGSSHANNNDFTPVNALQQSSTAGQTYQKIISQMDLSGQTNFPVLDSPAFQNLTSEPLNSRYDTGLTPQTNFYALHSRQPIFTKYTFDRPLIRAYKGKLPAPDVWRHEDYANYEARCDINTKTKPDVVDDSKVVFDDNQREKISCIYKNNGFQLQFDDVDENVHNGNSAEYRKFVKKIEIGVVRKYLRGNPGDEQFMNPILPMSLMNEMFNCPKAESFKTVSVSYGSANCQIMFNNLRRQRFKNIKSMHIEDTMFFIQHMESSPFYKELQQRDGPLGETMTPFRLLTQLLMSKPLENIFLKSLILSMDNLLEFESFKNRNSKMEEEDRCLKNVKTIHLESLIVEKQYTDSVDQFWCYVVKNASTVPSFSLHIQKDAYGVTLLNQLSKLSGVTYPSIKLLISIDSVDNGTVDAMHAIQSKTDQFKLQYYAPFTLEPLDNEALRRMTRLQALSWRNITELIIGRERNHQNEHNQHILKYMCKWFDDVSNLKHLAVYDQHSFTLLRGLCYRTTDRRTITKMTLSMAPFEHTFKSIKKWHRASFELFERLPFSLEHLVCYGMPIDETIMTKIAERYCYLKTLKVRHAVEMNLNENIIRECFARVKRNVEIDFDLMMEGPHVPTPVEHWLDVDRSNLYESPLCSDARIVCPYRELDFKAREKAFLARK